MNTSNKVKPRSQDSEVVNYAKQRGMVLACILIDCLYVSIWAIGMWATNNYVVTPLSLTGVDKIILDIFQWISGIATLFTVLVYVIRDSCIFVLRTWSEIKEVSRAFKKKP